MIPYNPTKTIKPKFDFSELSPKIASDPSTGEGMFNINNDPTTLQNAATTAERFNEYERLLIEICNSIGVVSEWAIGSQTYNSLGDVITHIVESMRTTSPENIMKLITSLHGVGVLPVRHSLTYGREQDDDFLPKRMFEFCPGHLYVTGRRMYVDAGTAISDSSVIPIFRNGDQDQEIPMFLDEFGEQRTDLSTEEVEQLNDFKASLPPGEDGIPGVVFDTAPYIFSAEGQTVETTIGLGLWPAFGVPIAHINGAGNGTLNGPLPFDADNIDYAGKKYTVLLVDSSGVTTDNGFITSGVTPLKIHSTATDDNGTINMSDGTITLTNPSNWNRTYYTYYIYRGERVDLIQGGRYIDDLGIEREGLNVKQGISVPPGSTTIDALPIRDFQNIPLWAVKVKPYVGDEEGILVHPLTDIVIEDGGPFDARKYVDLQPWDEINRTPLLYSEITLTDRNVSNYTTEYMADPLINTVGLAHGQYVSNQIRLTYDTTVMSTGIDRYVLHTFVEDSSTNIYYHGMGSLFGDSPKFRQYISEYFYLPYDLDDLRIRFVLERDLWPDDPGYEGGGNWGTGSPPTGVINIKDVQLVGYRSLGISLESWSAGVYGDELYGY